MPTPTVPSLARCPRAALAALLLATAACASSGAKTAARPTRPDSAAANPASSNATGLAGSAPRSRNQNVITEAELRLSSGYSSVYDLVSALRPRWLQARAADSFQTPTQVQAYLGSTRIGGGVSGLRDVPTVGISRLEWIDPITAAARWGLDHGAGAIVVTPSTR